MQSDASNSSRLTYLDGLRGWAAVVVLLDHIFPFFLLRVNGPSADGLRHLLLNGPIVGRVEYAMGFVGVVLYRFLTDGLTAVYVFFVLSGYVLSVGYVKTRNKELITDQALRRYIRLTVPISSACFIAFFLLKSGLMYNQRVDAAVGGDWIGGFYHWSPGFDSLLRFSLFDVYFNFSDSRSFIFTLWTMQIEFFGSFLIFSLLAIFGHLRNRWIPYGLALIAVCLINRNLISFMLGLFIAELYQFEQVRAVLAGKKARIAVSVMLAVVVTLPVLVFHFLPRGLFSDVSTLAATVIVVSTIMLRPLQTGFTSRVSVFLGKISFSLYLVHPLVICSIGAWYFVVMRSYLSLPVLISSCAVLIAGLSVMFAKAFVSVDSWGITQARRFASMVQVSAPRHRRDEAVTENPAAVPK